MSVRGWHHVCSEHAGQQHRDLLLVVAVFLTEQRDQIALFFPTLHIRSHGIAYYPAGLHGHKNPLTAWLRELQLMGKLADAKRFPECVWRWDRPRVAEFIRTLMSCDGTIYSVGGYPRIEFAVASQGLAEDIHHAFVRFGIVAKFWKKKERWHSD